MDVLVKGAGPAGCTAARLLAASGFDVLLVERPRTGPDHQMVVEQPVAPASAAGTSRLLLSFGGEAPRDFGRSNMVICSYRTLVESLREAAVAAGAVIATAVPDEDIPGLVVDATGAPPHSERPGHGWTVTGTWRNCSVEGTVVTHLTQPDDENPRAAPVVVRVVPVSGAPGTATVSVTTMSSRPLAGDRIESAVRSADPRMAAAVAVSPLTVYPVNAGFAPENAIRDGALAAGEAAGLVNPFTGDGISYAIRSAEIAAEAVARHRKDPSRVSDAYQAGLRASFVGYFHTARHAIRHYHLAWRILSSSASSEHPFFRQSHRAVLFGGAMAHDALRARREPADPVRLYLAPFTMACNEVAVRRIGDEWPLLAMHTLGGRDGLHRGIRPSALFAGALMAAGDHPDVRQAPVAAAIELALLGALAHSVPAGEASAPCRGVDWRYASSVMAADYLLATATDVLTTARPDLSAAFAAWLASLVALRAEHKAEALFETLFEFPARLGAYAAGSDDATVDVLRRFGRTCGRLFLLAEDRALLLERQGRLDTTLTGALAARLTGLPVRFGRLSENEMRARRNVLAEKLDETIAGELRAVDESVAKAVPARCERVLRYFARSLANPVPGVDEEAAR
ncbi:FAD-dependent monooxygenase [Amycolatopsis rubida]|uniref:Dehydrogenase (Flavoprotein) n=1 Tax=Amycolatopsis rubida TaxID=112413 RepID=A0A1I5ZCE4_9PSEU|nr:FAD-dependent monooxygenase [Amycolatopsis rubida]SFQ54124.1 Dehydrogenase (flavoprotein) [Amycolatopsis rubida]